MSCIIVYDWETYNKAVALHKEMDGVVAMPSEAVRLSWAAASGAVRSCHVCL